MIITIMITFVFSMTGVFATSEVDIPAATEYSLDELVLDVMEPLEDGTLRQYAGGYVNGVIVEEALTKHLFQLSWMEELVLHSENWETDALLWNVLADMTRAVVLAETPEYYNYFAFGVTKLEDYDKRYVIEIDGTDDFMKYGDTVNTLRLFYGIMHKGVGLQEDRGAYVNRCDLLNKIQEAFPDWVPSEDVLECYNVERTLIPLQAAHLFEQAARDILGEQTFERISDGMCYYEWEFDLKDAKNSAIVGRGLKTVILPEELDESMAQFIAFMNEKL